MYRNFFKPLIDISVALVVLILTSPILLIATILLAFANRGKPFFIHLRPGKHEHVFKVIKFKTMNDKKDAAGNLLPDGDRLTLIGKIIRKTSVDELPQLINVLKGDMSLIGPRPLLVSYLPLYNAVQRRRHEIKPGITGWAQVNGRNAISWEKKFEYDVWYIEHISFLLDVKIVWMTVMKVFKSEGISAGQHATMPFFEGNNK